MFWYDKSWCPACLFEEETMSGVCQFCLFGWRRNEEFDVFVLLLVGIVLLALCVTHRKTKELCLLFAGTERLVGVCLLFGVCLVLSMNKKNLVFSVWAFAWRVLTQLQMLNLLFCVRVWLELT